jgi:rubrerythrin
MPRYIDADALKETLKDLKAEGSNKQYVKGLQDGVDGFFPQIIDDEPTADVESVRHGRWKKTGDYLSARDFSMHYYFKCSCCNEITIDNGDYCPNCGAKMDGGSE